MAMWDNNGGGLLGSLFLWTLQLLKAGWRFSFFFSPSFFHETSEKLVRREKKDK